MITAGIDCGARNTKTIILADARILGRGMVATGFNPEQAVEDSLEAALRDAGIGREQIEGIVGTGSGRESVTPADDTADEIRSMTRGAMFFFPSARTVVDVGAEEGRAARIDENGGAVEFAVNERCAAGAGMFIEAMGRALETPIERMGELALESDRQIPINAQCVVFAESEVVGLIHANTAKRDISRAIHDAMAGRIVSMIRRIGVNEDVVLIGGVGANRGFLQAMRRELKLEKIFVPDRPEFGSAVGAAVLAVEK